MAEVLFRAKLHRDMSSVPWGFRLQGGDDFDRPLTLVKVLEKSVAAIVGLQAGDIIIKLAGLAAEDMTHRQAQDAIINSGNDLEIIVGRDEEVIMAPSSPPCQSEEDKSKITQENDDYQDLEIHDANNNNPELRNEMERNESIVASDDEYIRSQMTVSDLSIIDVRPVSTSPIPTIIISTPSSPTQEAISFVYPIDHGVDFIQSADIPCSSISEHVAYADDNNITAVESTDIPEVNKDESTTVLDKLENLKKDINMITNAMNEVIEADKKERNELEEIRNETPDLSTCSDSESTRSNSVNSVIEIANDTTADAEEEIPLQFDMESIDSDPSEVPSSLNDPLEKNDSKIEPSDVSLSEIAHPVVEESAPDSNISNHISEESHSSIQEEKLNSTSSTISDLSNILLEKKDNEFVSLNTTDTNFENKIDSITVSDSSDNFEKSIFVPDKKESPAIINKTEDTKSISNFSNNSKKLISNADQSELSAVTDTIKDSFPNIDALPTNLTNCYPLFENSYELNISNHNTNLDNNTISNSISTVTHDSSGQNIVENNLSKSETSLPSLKLIGTRTERFIKPTKPSQFYPNFEETKAPDYSYIDPEINIFNNLSSNAQAKLLARRMSAPDAHFGKSNNVYKPSRTADIHFSMSTVDNPDLVDIPMPQVKEMVADLNRRLDVMAEEHPILTNYGVNYATFNSKNVQQFLFNDGRKEARRDKNQSIRSSQNKTEIKRVHFDDSCPNLDMDRNMSSFNNKTFKNFESLSKQSSSYMINDSFNSVNMSPASTHILNIQYSPTSIFTNVSRENIYTNSQNKSNISSSISSFDNNNMNNSIFFQGNFSDSLYNSEYNSRNISNNLESKKITDSSHLTMRKESPFTIEQNASLSMNNNSYSPNQINVSLFERSGDGITSQMITSPTGKQTHFTCTLPSLQRIDTKTIDYSPPPSYEESIKAQQRREIASQQFEQMNSFSNFQSPYRGIPRINESNLSVNQTFHDVERQYSNYSPVLSPKSEYQTYQQMNGNEISYSNLPQYDHISPQPNCQSPYRGLQGNYSMTESNNSANVLSIFRDQENDFTCYSPDSLAKFEKHPHLQSKSFKALEAFYTDMKRETSSPNYLSPVSVEILGQPHEVLQPAAIGRPFSKPPTFPPNAFNPSNVAELTSKYKDIPLPSQLQEPPPGQTYMPLIPGVYAMFDREFSEKFEAWKASGGRRNHFQSETAKLVQEMDDERRLGCNN